MTRDGRFSLLVVGALLATAGLAGDDAASDTETTSSPPPSPSLEKLLEESGYAPRWRLTPPFATAPYAGEWPQPMANFQFQEANGIARVTRLRTLSLLTLARSGQARLFFGVNEDGLVGFHYRAVTRDNEAAYLELARMPYLSDSPTDSEEEPDSE